jgi:hypothetical protein
VIRKTVEEGIGALPTEKRQTNPTPSLPHPFHLPPSPTHTRIHVFTQTYSHTRIHSHVFTHMHSTCIDTEGEG